MAEIFLSYNRDDQATARRFAEGLERAGFSVWWDATLNAGEAYDKVTEKALEEAKAVVVLWSKTSVESRWVRAEATQAIRNGTLVPVMIEPCKRPIMFELTQTADLSGWAGDRGDVRWTSFIDGLRRFTGERAPIAPETAPTPAAPGAPRKRIIWAAAVAAALIAIVAGGLWYSQHWRVGTPTGGAAPPTVQASIAVLPFRDLSPNKDQEYFADGVTEELLNTLAGVQDLKVTARTSAFAFKGKDVDLREVGATLGVQHILEGSVRKDGETLRVTAQLIDAMTDGHLWSKTYDRQLKDVFQVQEDISRSVAQALQVKLRVGFGKQSGMTRDIDAYDAFLAGDDPLAADRRRAIESLEQAVGRDPKFGVAAVRLYAAYQDMIIVQGNPEVWESKAAAALEQFQRVAPPDEPSLQLMLFTRSKSQGRWREALSHLRAAFEAATKLGETLDSEYEMQLRSAVGQTRQAVAILEQDRARDPLNPLVAFALALLYGQVGDTAGVVAESERANKLGAQGEYFVRAAALTNAQGTRDRARVRRALDDVIALAPDPTGTSLNQQMKSMQDDPANALKLLRGLARNPSTPALDLTIQALWLSYFGDWEAAMVALQTAFRRGGGGAILASINLWALVHAEMRRQPAFKQLVRDFGLVDYWREFGWGDYCKPVGETDFECS